MFTLQNQVGTLNHYNGSALESKVTVANRHSTKLRFASAVCSANLSTFRKR